MEHIISHIEALVGLVADLQHRLEAAPRMSSDPALQQRISDVTTAATQAAETLKTVTQAVEEFAESAPDVATQG